MASGEPDLEAMWRLPGRPAGGILMEYLEPLGEEYLVVLGYGKARVTVRMPRESLGPYLFQPPTPK